jgi:hypothetical protein
MDIINDKDLDGKIVYLTKHLESWYKELTPNFNVPITNRLAKIVKVFDWDTEEGKLLLEAREKTGKWNNLDAKSFKFVLKVYYPDLNIKKSKKVTIEEVMPRLYPGTQNAMFQVVPDWMLSDIIKEEKNTFTVVKK